MPTVQATITFSVSSSTKQWEIEREVEKAAQDLAKKVGAFGNPEYALEISKGDPIAELITGLAEVGRLAMEERAERRGRERIREERERIRDQRRTR